MPVDIQRQARDAQALGCASTLGEHSQARLLGVERPTYTHGAGTLGPDPAPWDLTRTCDTSICREAGHLLIQHTHTHTHRECTRKVGFTFSLLQKPTLSQSLRQATPALSANRLGLPSPGRTRYFLEPGNAPVPSPSSALSLIEAAPHLLFGSGHPGSPSPWVSLSCPPHLCALSLGGLLVEGGGTGGLPGPFCSDTLDPLSLFL